MFSEFMHMTGGASWAIVGTVASLAISFIVLRIFNYFDTSEVRSIEARHEQYRMELAARAKQIEHRRDED